MTPVHGVEVGNLTRFADDLERLSDSLPGAVEKVLVEAGDIVAAEARRRAPRVTGALAASITVKPLARGAVRITAPVSKHGFRYAARVEFDESRRHTPFLYGAVDAVGDQAVRRITTGVLSLIDAYWKEHGAIHPR